MRPSIAAILVATVSCGSEVAPSQVPASGGAGGAASSATSSAAVGGATGSTSSGTGGGGAAGGGAGGEGPAAHVTVFVYGAGLAGEAGVTIAVNDARGSVVTTTQTGPDGTVAVAVPAGGLVAAYPPYDEDHEFEMTAVVDPPDGAVIFLPSHFDPPSAQQLETKYDVAATGYPPSTVEIEVRTCWTMGVVAASPTGTTSLLADDDKCPPSPVNTIVVIAKDGADQPVAWGRVEALASPGNVVPVSVIVDQTSFVSFTDRIEPIPATAEKAGILLTSMGQNPPLFYVAESVPSPSSSVEWSVIVPDTPIQFLAADGVGMTDNGYLRSATRIRTYDVLPAGTVTFDPGALAPVYVEPMDASDPAHPIATWTSGQGDPGDALYMSFYPQGLVQSPPTYQIPRFTIYAPAGLTPPFRLPDHPVSATHFALDGPNGIPTAFSGTVALHDDESAPGWSDFHLFKGPLVVHSGLVVSASNTPAP